MSERDEPMNAAGASAGRRALTGDLVIPIGTVAFAIYYLYTIWGLPWQAAAAGIGVISAMAVLLVVLAIRFVGEFRRGEADFGMGELVYPLSASGQRLAILLAALGFIYVMQFLGFTISLFIFLMAGIMLLSGLRQIRMGLVIALSVSIGGYLLFIVFVRARFPRGPFENFMASWF